MTAEQPTVLHRNRGESRTLRPPDGRRSNLSLVLQSLYDQPQLTRPDLARLTGLTKVTICDLVAQLIDEGWVSETGVTSGVRPGKPAATLAVREDSHQIIALDLSAPDIWRGGVYSLRGVKSAQVNLDLAESLVGDAATTAVLDLVGRCLAEATQPILGIGVGSPGLVDAAGTVIAAPNLGWRQVDLQHVIASHFALPTAVQNDANAAVVAEKAFASGGNDLIRVQIARGVGVGILVSGSPVLGASAAAGEIGHTVIEHRGEPCSCGKRGCLETWISVPALNRRLRDAELGAGTGGAPANGAGSRHATRSTHAGRGEYACCDYAQRDGGEGVPQCDGGEGVPQCDGGGLAPQNVGDGRSSDSVLAEAGRRLGIALSMVVAALDVPEIVLGGPPELIGEGFLEACRDLIIERTHSPFRRDFSMRLSNLGDEAVLLGAVSLVLRTTLGVS